MNGFHWDEFSTLPPDGVSVKADDSQCFPGSATISGGTGYRQLPHRNIIFGSLDLTCDDPALAFNDLRDGSGHGQWCISGQPNQEFVRHATGQVRLPDPNRTWEANYLYVPDGTLGRWIRDWGPLDPVTPEMLGGSIQWSATIAGRLGRNLRGNGERWRHIVEIPAGVEVSGRFQLDAEYAIAAFGPGSYHPQNGWLTKLDKLLLRGMPCITPASGVKHAAFRDLTLTGNYADVDWQFIATSAEWGEIIPGSNPPASYRTSLSQRLRESPSVAGISLAGQSGRIPVESCYFDNVSIGGFPGSCVLGDTHSLLYGQHVTIGSTVSGRPLYAEGPIDLTDLRFEGFTRTSTHRGGPQSRIDGLVYRSGGIKNPWPQNDEPGIVAACSNVRGDGWVEWRGINVDLRGSDIPGGIGIGASGEFSGTIRGGTVSGIHPNSRGALVGRWNLEIIDGAPPILSFPSGSGQATWANLDATLTLRRIDKRPPLPEPVDAATYAVWQAGLDVGPVVRVKRNEFHPPGHTQNIRLQITTDWPLMTVLSIVDLVSTPAADCVPTQIVIHDSRLSEQFTTLVQPQAGLRAIPAGLGAKPVRVIFSNCVLNIQRPRPWRGDAQPNQWEYIQLVNCHDPNGRLIDVEKIKDGSWWQ